jgi:transcriptional regulator NrdR family protein
MSENKDIIGNLVVKEYEDIIKNISNDIDEKDQRSVVIHNFGEMLFEPLESLDVITENI